MKCCMHYYSMGIIKIYFGKSHEKLKKTFLAGLQNYNRKGYPQQTFFKGWPNSGADNSNYNSSNLDTSMKFGKKHPYVILFQNQS